LNKTCNHLRQKENKSLLLKINRVTCFKKYLPYLERLWRFAIGHAAILAVDHYSKYDNLSNPRYFLLDT